MDFGDLSCRLFNNGFDGDADEEDEKENMPKSISQAELHPNGIDTIPNQISAMDEGIGSDHASVGSDHVGARRPIFLRCQSNVDEPSRKIKTPMVGIIRNDSEPSVDCGPVSFEVANFMGYGETGEKESDDTSPASSPSNSVPIISSYDWPMTFTEKVMTKYAYKKQLEQFLRRMENIFPRFVSGQRETIAAGFREMRQVILDAWDIPNNEMEMVNNICYHFQRSGQLEFVITCFITDQYDLGAESGRVLELCLSENTCAYLLENGRLKDITRAVIQQELYGRDDEIIRISVSLLENMLRYGPVICKMLVANGGLYFLMDICKNHLNKEDTRAHVSAALANLAVFGGFQVRRMMVEKQLPAWLFLLLTSEDIRVKYYAGLCLCMMASHKELVWYVRNSGSLPLVTAFLKTCRPEKLAKMDSKYRECRSSQWLKAFARLLYSEVSEVLSMATFQFAVEASRRRKSTKIDIFENLRLVPRIQEIASIPGNDLASTFATDVLNTIGQRVPHRLSPTAPLWTVKDVQYWVKKIGFGMYAELFGKHRVDGDLLLRTKDEHLRNEIGMTSSYDRIRFMRELKSLKRSSDYGPVDRTRLDSWLMRLDPEFSAYTYQMLLNGVDRNTLIHLNDQILQEQCGVENNLHRVQLMHSIREAKHEEELDLAVLRKQVDIFICYRRSTGSQLASLLKVHLQLRGFKVFIDVDNCDGGVGHPQKSLHMNIRAAKHFVLVLTPGTLDTRAYDDPSKDKIHLEIQTALQYKSNIVPIQEKGFQWPPIHQLPPDIRPITAYNSIQWVHEYQEACVDKLHRFITGQASVNTNGVAPAPIID